MKQRMLQASTESTTQGDQKSTETKGATKPADAQKEPISNEN
jgi:hypothetical protein